MSIKEYYYKLGNISLNISLFFLVLTVMMTMFFIYLQEKPIASAFLILLSVFYYMTHLYYVKRSNHVSLVSGRVSGQSEQLELSYLLIQREPSTIYFFKPNGRAEIMMKRKHTIRGIFLLYLENNKEVERVQLKKEKAGIISFYREDGQLFGWLDSSNNKLTGEIYCSGKCIKIQREPFKGLIFQQDYQQLANVKKGWLPIHWTSLFRLNTPVMSFQEKLSHQEKVAILFISSLIYS